MSFHVPNEYRLRDHPILGSSDADGNNGFFLIPNDKGLYAVQASDGLGWEHISVSLQRKYKDGTLKTLRLCPTWGQMCSMKSVFWDAENIVIQFHPAESDYRNLHEFTLHLWRPVDLMFPCPPSEMIA